MSRPLVLLVGPKAQALARSPLAASYSLVPFEGNPLQLAAQILRRNARIVHVDGSAAAVLVAKLCGARVVFHPRSKAPSRLADVNVVRSESERLEFDARLPVAVVPQGIDASPYLKYNRSVPDAGASLRLLTLGTDREMEPVLHALQLVAGKGITPHLTIAGAGREEPRLRARVRELRLGEQVTFAGPAWGEFKVKLLRNADVLLACAEDEQALEAMAAGVIPVMERNAGVLAGQIEALDGDRAVLARKSQACRQRVLAEHSLQRLADDFSAIYSVLIPWQVSQAG
jgi:glycosyltransferase involved in cell wall biosynthesis